MYVGRQALAPSSGSGSYCVTHAHILLACWASHAPPACAVLVAFIIFYTQVYKQ